MAYAEKRDGKLTGYWYGEAFVKGKRFRHRFAVKKDAEGYETYVRLMGTEPPTMAEGDAGAFRTFAQVAKEAKEAGGPDGKWLNGRDHSIIQRVDYVTGVVGHVDIEKFKRADYEAIVKSLRNRPPSASNTKLRGPQAGAASLSNSTINRYLNAASAVLTFAVQAEYRDSKPEVPLLPEVSRKRDILHSYEQEDAILKAMEANGDHVEAVCVRVLVETGLREGELLEALTPAQITIETDEDHTENGWIKLHEDQTKNNSARTVYIRPELALEIRSIIAKGQLPSSSRLLSKFKRAAKQCGASDNLVIHSLRHTRNTRLRREGVDIKIRMKMLGHKSISTSMRYDHVDTEDQLKAAKKVERSRGEAKPSGEIISIRKVSGAG